MPRLPWAKPALALSTVFGLGAATLLTGAVVPVASAAPTPAAIPALAPAAAPAAGLVAWYPLDEESGSVAKDASGSNRNASVKGAATWNHGSGFTFSGGPASSGNAIKLPDNLLASLDSITVSMDVWVDPALNGNHFVYNLGNEAVGTPQSGKGYLFSTTLPQYRATISSAAWGNEQVTKAGSAVAKSTWKRLSYTQTGSVGVLYEDGKEVARNTAVTTTPAQIGGGTTTKNILGASAYSADASFKGRLRDVRIYDRALAASDVAELAVEGREQLAVEDADAAVAALGDTDAVVADLTLPALGERGSALKWSSSDTSALSNSGAVTRAKEDRTLTLSLTASAGSVSTSREVAVTVPGVANPDQAVLDAAAAKLGLEGLDDVRGNITLPATASGIAVNWSSDQPGVLSASGVAARPAHGEAPATAKLTATLKRGESTVTKEFTATLPALPEPAEKTGYMFTYFTGDSLAGEKIYFGASNGNNARDWIDLNGAAPVFTSDKGTKGLRDPFIVRSPEGDTFYMIATDLSIGGGTSWNDSQRTGSRSIEVWESHDLVNWTEQRHVVVSPETAGNTWAPEAYWDESLGSYVVFWASKLYAANDPSHSNGSPPNTMMYATTRDFRTFSEAKVWQDTGVSRIDSTVIEEDGTYYRFTKDEAQKYGCLDVFGESSTSLTAVTTAESGWTMGQKCIGKSAGTGAVEGPTVFKANPGDVNGEGYYLFVDEFSGRKYLPLFSPSLTQQKWSAVSDAKLPSPAPRHGTVLPVTAAEYQRLLGAYLPKPTAAAPVTRNTTVGTKITLPRTTTVTFADGSTKDLSVAWDALPSGYENTAATLSVNGKINGLELSATATVNVKAAVEQGTLLRYDFSALSKATAGTAVPDASGKGNDGVLKGNGAAVSGDTLTLPGGASNSGAAYVEMPKGVFDGQDTLTVSVWLKNQTGAGNYAALYFGSSAATPSNYWLFNPRNGANQFKSVITGSVNAAAPWGTETGIAPTNAAQGIPGPATGSDWALYTTVLEKGKLSAYLNGQAIGTVQTGRSVSDLGKDLVAYIGRSSYPDKFYQGGVKDLLVTTTAATAQDVKARYFAGLSSDAIDTALRADADALNLPQTTITDLQLDIRGRDTGAAITWASSDAAHLAANGKVNRPAGSDAEVKLTATLALGGRSVTREFTVKVLSSDPTHDVAAAADAFKLGVSSAWQDLTLPSSLGAVALAWASSDEAALGTDGTVHRSGEERKVTLTATFSLNGASQTRSYDVTVLAEDTSTATGYLTAGGTKFTDVLHLAVTDSDGVTKLGNKGRAILYPSLGSMRYASTSIFRKPAGGFGLVAPEASASGPTGKVYVYDSSDLTAYSNERLVTPAPGHTFSSLAVSYDNASGLFTLSYTNLKDSVEYSVTTADFTAFSPAQAKGPLARSATTLMRLAKAAVELPDGATAAQNTPLTSSEAERLNAKLGRVTNTGVSGFDDVALSVGDDVPAAPDTAKLEYSSGSTSTFPVQWDQAALDAVDTSKPGSYEVTGTVERPSYENPLVERRADPDVTLGDDGWYYFTSSYPMTNASDPEGYDRVILRRAKTIAGLKDAEEVSIWDESSTPDYNRYIWAPELQKIGNDWYVLFTAARKGGVWDIRPTVLKYTGGEFTGDKVMDAANWSLLGQVKAAAGDTQAFTSFSLDMTAFEQNGRHYLVWAEKPGASTLRMGEIDPQDPTQLISASILLAAPTQAWERNDEQNQQVDEGPAVIHHDGKVYISFSASTVDRHYAVGLLAADEGADLMDPASWTKTGYPLLTTDDVPGQMGPGHNSFTVDQWGNPVMVFHSRTQDDSSQPGEATDEGLYDPRRHARATTVHFDVDGDPVFNMSADEELSPALAKVSYTVTVAAETPEPTDPTEPTGPVDPTDPTDPTGPTGPSNPGGGSTTPAVPTDGSGQPSGNPTSGEPGTGGTDGTDGPGATDGTTGTGGSTPGSTPAATDPSSNVSPSAGGSSTDVAVNGVSTQAPEELSKTGAPVLWWLAFGLLAALAGIGVTRRQARKH